VPVVKQKKRIEKLKVIPQIKSLELLIVKSLKAIEIPKLK